MDWNGARWKRGDAGGHYESWFLRGNAGDQAFWIRYTLFSPKGNAAAAVGELWAIWFERGGAIVAVKSELPVARVDVAADRLAVKIGDAALDAVSARGSASAAGHTIAWDLQYSGGTAPLLLMPKRMYELPLPRAKAIVPQPLARFTGVITVDGKAHAIASWVGSQNHNWGSRHTDRYAWGQVAGFDEAPDAFLECSTARLKLGPVMTPPLSVAALRLGDEVLSWTGLVYAARALGAYAPYQWHLETSGKHGSLDVRMRADASEFVALRYPNPPGGTKICLNSKLAHCEITVRRPNQPPLVLQSSRAAFEILDDTAPPGVEPKV